MEEIYNEEKSTIISRHVKMAVYAWGLDLDEPSKWIRIVKDDGQGGVQGHEIDFAKPLDIIEFKADQCHKVSNKRTGLSIIVLAKNKGKDAWTIETNREGAWLGIQKYAYKILGNYKAFLNEQEFEALVVPSESIMKISNVRIYKNDWDRAKIDFDWFRAKYRINGLSMTDQDFYSRINEGEVYYDNAYIVISIPKYCDWTHPETGEKRAYKFVSRIYEI